MDENGMFIDAIDGSVTLDVCDNGDGRHVILNLITDTNAIGMALTYEQIHELADHLHTME